MLSPDLPIAYVSANTNGRLAPVGKQSGGPEPRSGTDTFALDGRVEPKARQVDTRKAQVDRVPQFVAGAAKSQIYAFLA